MTTMYNIGHTIATLQEMTTSIAGCGKMAQEVDLLEEFHRNFSSINSPTPPEHLTLKLEKEYPRELIDDGLRIIGYLTPANPLSLHSFNIFLRH